MATYPIPDFGLCADITMAANVNIFITDTLLARVLILETEAYNSVNGNLAIWSDDPILVGSEEAFLKINGISKNRNAIFTTNYSTGTLYRIPVKADGSAGAAQVIETDIPLSTPDGIRMLSHNQLLVTQNSGALVRIKIRGNQGIVKVVNNELDQPSSVVRVGWKLWVTEGQILRLVGADPSHLNFPFKVKKVRIK